MSLYSTFGVREYCQGLSNYKRRLQSSKRNLDTSGVGTNQRFSNTIRRLQSPKRNLLSLVSGGFRGLLFLIPSNRNICEQIKASILLID